jgi:dTDP-4-dehydrorhamnose 3,5-epimerase
MHRATSKGTQTVDTPRASEGGGELPLGCRILPLEPRDDDRGRLTELFRAEWDTGAAAPIQWNAVRSDADVLRGVHVHTRHDDYLTVPLGRMFIGLHDMRRGSASFGASCLVELTEDDPSALVVPHGVAHGFWIPEPSLFVYGVSHYWDPTDELGCHWGDPALGIDWPCTAPRLSARDAAAPPLSDLAELIEVWQPLV